MVSYFGVRKGAAAKSGCLSPRLRISGRVRW
jgi:hypothetical protein